MPMTTLCVTLHHACFLVDDVSEAFDRLRRSLGLPGESYGDHAVLRCMHEDYCLVQRQRGEHASSLEVFIELCCDMQILEPDHEPVTHPDTPYSSNTWGTLPPRSYFRFDDESVRLEREQAHAYLDPLDS